MPGRAVVGLIAVFAGAFAIVAGVVLLDVTPPRTALAVGLIVGGAVLDLLGTLLIAVALWKPGAPGAVRRRRQTDVVNSLGGFDLH